MTIAQSLLLSQKHPRTHGHNKELQYFNLQSRTKRLTHFVFGRKFRVEIPLTSHCNADQNVIDELTSMSSSSNQHCSGGRGALAVEGSSLHAGKASFNAKLICPNEFCPRLYAQTVGTFP